MYVFVFGMSIVQVCLLTLAYALCIPILAALMHYSKSKMSSKLKECTVHTLLTLHSYLLPLFVASLPAGTILCSVGYESGQVKVFSVSVGLAWGGSEFSLSASLATELHQMSSQSGEHTHTHTRSLYSQKFHD